MKNATVRIVLRKDKVKADGTAPLWIRITAQRKSRYIATGLSVDPKAWNSKKRQVRASHPLSAALNARLEDMLLQTKQQALETPSAEAVKAALAGAGGTFAGYFERFIEDLEAADRFWDWKKYRTTLGKLQACFGTRIDWQDLDRQALVRFERYLRETCHNNPNTTRKELQRVGRVFKQAVRDEVIRPEQDPFLIYERPKGEQPHRRKLTLEEIRRLEALEVTGALRVARDAFLLAFYGGGVRFGDICRLRPENVQEGRLHYRMMKTGNLVEVPLPPQALAIISRYAAEGPSCNGNEAKCPFLFPFLKKGETDNPVRLRRRIASNNTRVNLHLKQLAALAEIEPAGLSTHTARHSFADYARQKSGDLYAVSKALGHSSLQVTQQYLRSFDQDAVDRLAEQLWTQ